MQIVNLKTIDSVATYVADILIQRIQDFQPTEQKPFLVLGLPTGSTPIPVYQQLVQAYQQGIISFKHVVTFNMDEYVGLAPEHKQSYHYFMQEHLFQHIDIPQNQIYILNGMALDLETECVEYEQKIASFGGIDIQLGGIGENGHLAFNEPKTPFTSLTHVQQLTQNTIEVNSRFFDSLSDVPTQALTIGLQTIFNAKQIIIMATGNKKYNAVKTVSSGQVSVNCPTTLLNNHNDAVIICDEAAYPQN